VVHPESGQLEIKEVTHIKKLLVEEYYICTFVDY